MYIVSSCRLIIINASDDDDEQDFALDPDESRMRMAAHHLVRFMTAGMALITCHEPVLISINAQLKNAFITALGVSRCVSRLHRITTNLSVTSVCLTDRQY